jgi:hypothetical protein
MSDTHSITVIIVVMIDMIAIVMKDQNKIMIAEATQQTVIIKQNNKNKRTIYVQQTFIRTI